MDDEHGLLCASMGLQRSAQGVPQAPGRSRLLWELAEGSSPEGREPQALEGGKMAHTQPPLECMEMDSWII